MTRRSSNHASVVPLFISLVAVVLTASVDAVTDPTSISTESLLWNGAAHTDGDVAKSRKLGLSRHQTEGLAKHNIRVAHKEKNHPKPSSFHSSLPPAYQPPEGIAPPSPHEPRLDQVVTFILGSTSYPNPWHNWHTRVEPSLRTWAPAFQHLFVVLPNSPQTFDFLAEHACVSVPVAGEEHGDAAVQWKFDYSCPEYRYGWDKQEQQSKSRSRERNVRVVLAESSSSKLSCPQMISGSDAACCKANFALWYMLTIRRSLLAQAKWVGILNDNVYIHPESFADLLDSANSSRPLSIVPSSGCFRRPRPTIKRHDHVDSMYPAKCDSAFADTYWAHPLWLSRSAVETAAPGVLAGGIRDQCTILGKADILQKNVDFHYADYATQSTGLGLFLWMYEIPCAGINPSQLGTRSMRPGQAIMLSHSTRSGNVPLAADATTSANSIPRKDLKMHQVHNFFTSNTTKAKAISNRVQDDAYGKRLGLGGLPPPVGPPQIPTGYSRIVHSQLYHIRAKWAILNNSGCMNLPGYQEPVSSRRRLEMLSPNQPLSVPESYHPYRAPPGVASPARLERRLNKVATFIMGTASPKSPWFNWYTRIVPSFRTWGPAFQYLFVVLPSNPGTKAFLKSQGCSPVPLGKSPNSAAWTHEYTCQAYAYENETHEVRIVLTETSNFDCTDEYHGDGPCCKANFALWYMLTVRRSLFDTLDWVGFIDDDIYVQPQAFADMLDGVNASAPVAIIPGDKCFRMPFHVKPRNEAAARKDHFPTKCKQFFADSYWAHPVWLSRPAVEAAAVGILAGGIRDQCALISSSHEAGLGTFLWMYGVPCAGMSGFVYSSRGRLEHASLAVVHRARPQMNTDPPPFNKSSTPLDQVPPHVLKMHQVHTYLSSPASEEGLAALDMTLTSDKDHLSVKDMLQHFQMKFNTSAEQIDLWKVKHTEATAGKPTGVMVPKFPKGYKRTSHAAEFDIKSKWAPLTNEGCTSASLEHEGANEFT